MSLFSHLRGAITGFAKGGISGGIAGAIAGSNNGRPATAKPKAVSQAITTALPTTNTFSGSGLVRLASSAPLPTLPRTIPTLAPSVPMGGGGATGSWTPAAQMPTWAYHRLYTKKGTPRRTRADGMPYAAPRMNPMNVRAARRAIRRIRGARKLLQRIERSLPKQTVRRRA